MELSSEQYSDLIKQHIEKMWGGLEMASVQHFCETGTVSGSFRLRLVSLMKFHQWAVEREQQPTLSGVEPLSRNGLQTELWNMLPDECRKIMEPLKASYIESLMADVDSYCAGQRASGVESAGVWVNCDKRLPAIEDGEDYPPKYILKCRNDGSRGHRDVYFQDAASIREIHKNYDYSEWLDPIKSAFPPSSNGRQLAIGFAKWMDDNGYGQNPGTGRYYGYGDKWAENLEDLYDLYIESIK